MKTIDRLMRDKIEELAQLNQKIKRAQAQLRRLNKSIEVKQPQERCRETTDWVENSRL